MSAIYIISVRWQLFVTVIISIFEIKYEIVENNMKDYIAHRFRLRSSWQLHITMYVMYDIWNKCLECSASVLEISITFWGNWCPQIWLKVIIFKFFFQEKAKLVKLKWCNCYPKGSWKNKSNYLNHFVSIYGKKHCNCTIWNNVDGMFIMPIIFPRLAYCTHSECEYFCDGSTFRG